jgi:hypothetical protein
MRIAQRTKYCFWANLCLLVVLVTCALLASPEGGLFTFGPSATLKIGSVVIDTWLRYWVLIILVCLFRSCSVVINDIGMPNLGFSIYDPTTETVYGFARTELQVLANGMFLVTSLSAIFSTLVIVARLDVALVSTLASELASAASIYYLLSKKKRFIKQCDTEEEWKRNSSSSSGNDDDAAAAAAALLV